MEETRKLGLLSSTVSALVIIERSGALPAYVTDSLRAVLARGIVRPGSDGRLTDTVVTHTEAKYVAAALKAYVDMDPLGNARREGITQEGFEMLVQYVADIYVDLQDVTQIAIDTAP